jgi:tRNA(Arg) A34 adenosine deaminase TadA
MQLVGCGWNEASAGDVCSGEVGNCGCLHAEVTASYYLENAHIFGDVVAFVTLSPCQKCLGVLASLECVGVIYDTISRHGIVESWIPQISYGAALDKIPSWWMPSSAS